MTSSSRSFGVVVSEGITTSHLKARWWLRVYMGVQLFWAWLGVVFSMHHGLVNFLLHSVINCLQAHQHQQITEDMNVDLGY